MLSKVLHSFRNMIVAVLAIERFVVVTWPFKAKIIWKNRNAAIAVIICGLIASLRLQYAFGVGNVWIWTANPCSGKWQFYNADTPEWSKMFWFPTIGDYWLHLTTALLPPVIISGVMSVGLFISLTKNVAQRATLVHWLHRNLQEEQHIIRSARSVLVVSVCFFLLQAPQAVDRSIGIVILITGIDTPAALIAFMTLSRNFANAMTVLDIVLDFVAVILVNKKYLEELKLILKCCICYQR